LCNSGFYLDELFGRIIEVISYKICLVGAMLIFEKWISKIMGVDGLRKALNWVNTRIYYQRLDVFILINLFILSLIGLVLVISVGSIIIAYF
jgi:hypothetical protein